MEIPTSWETTKLGEVLLSIVGGGTPSKSNASYYKGNIPWMSVKDMNKNILNDTVDHISEEAVKNSSTNIIPAGIPIIATRMGLGKIVVANFNSAINQDLKALFPSSGINRNYLINWYRSIARKIEELGTGTTVKGIRLEVLNSLEFPLPSLAEQKVISEKLDILLAQIESSKARLESIPDILKTFRQSILSAAMSGKLTEEWRTANGFISNNWDQVLAADVCLKITDGEHQTPKRQAQGRILLSAKNIRDGFIDYDNHDLISAEDFKKCLKRCHAEVNDVLIVSVGATIGRAAIKKDDIEFALVRSVGLFKIDPEKIIGEYLLYSLKSQKIQNFISESSRGNAQQTLSIKAMSSIPLDLPPLVEQKEIVRRIEELFALSGSIEQKVNAALDRVNSLSQSILARAFRGELTADWRAANPELISGDNSAEALLEKIKAERETIKRQPKPKRPTVKNKTGNCMNKQIIKVTEALKQAGKPLSGQQLLEAVGYPLDSNTDQLEQFFLDIRNALVIEKTIVKLKRDADSQDWFALVTSNQ